MIITPCFILKDFADYIRFLFLPVGILFRIVPREEPVAQLIPDFFKAGIVNQVYEFPRVSFVVVQLVRRAVIEYVFVTPSTNHVLTYPGPEIELAERRRR